MFARKQGEKISAKQAVLRKCINTVQSGPTEGKIPPDLMKLMTLLYLPHAHVFTVSMTHECYYFCNQANNNLCFDQTVRTLIKLTIIMEHIFVMIPFAHTKILSRIISINTTLVCLNLKKTPNPAQVMQTHSSFGWLLDQLT